MFLKLNPLFQFSGRSIQNRLESPLINKNLQCRIDPIKIRVCLYLRRLSLGKSLKVLQFFPIQRISYLSDTRQNCSLKSRKSFILMLVATYSYFFFLKQRILCFSSPKKFQSLISFIQIFHFISYHIACKLQTKSQ